MALVLPGTLTDWVFGFSIMVITWQWLWPPNDASCFWHAADFEVIEKELENVTYLS
jgi:hypothetical protein